MKKKTKFFIVYIIIFVKTLENAVKFFVVAQFWRIDLG